MNILEAHDIVKDFIGHRALNHVSIAVPEGEVFGLLGPNGAGKTTLLRIINQINYPDAGEVLFKGKPLQPTDANYIGYLPEERGLYKKMKLGEQALYLAKLKGVQPQGLEKELKSWFEKFNLQDWWDKKVENLSKGMAQKLQFIVTVVHKPQLLIFDEPFSGFDPVNANLLKQEILALKEQGTSIIFSTHNMESVEQICDSIALINKSEKVLEGKVKDLQEQFSGGEYRVVYEEVIKLQKPRHCQVLNTSPNAFELRAHPNVTPNELLQELMQYGQLKSFEKKVPSMNEIFIQTVQGKSN